MGVFGDQGDARIGGFEHGKLRSLFHGSRRLGEIALRRQGQQKRNLGPLPIDTGRFALFRGLLELARLATAKQAAAWAVTAATVQTYCHSAEKHYAYRDARAVCC